MEQITVGCRRSTLSCTSYHGQSTIPGEGKEREMSDHKGIPREKEITQEIDTYNPPRPNKAARIKLFPTPIGSFTLYLRGIPRDGTSYLPLYYQVSLSQEYTWKRTSYKATHQRLDYSLKDARPPDTRSLTTSLPYEIPRTFVGKKRRERSRTTMASSLSSCEVVKSMGERYVVGDS